MRSTERRFAMAMMTPAAVFLTLFVALPLGRLVYDSLFDVTPGVRGTRTFVGIDNYLRAFTSADFGDAAWRTVLYTMIVVTLELVLGLATALLFAALGDRFRIFRTVFLYPLMIAPVVAGLLWKFLLIDNFGILGVLLTNVGLLREPDQVGWLSNADIVLFSVALPDVWLTTSFMCLVFFAGLQNIPDDVVEAARLDGASALSLLRSIVVPLLRPVIAVALVVRGIDAVRAFDVILVQTGGGPQFASQTVSLLIYRTMTRFGEPGYASAMSSIYLVAMFVVAVVAVRALWQPGKEPK